MRSVRLDPELEERIRLAAEAMGESVSEFMREAAAARVDVVLASGPPADFTDVLGVVRGGGGRARRTGEAFAEAVGEARAAAPTEDTTPPEGTAPADERGA